MSARDDEPVSVELDADPALAAKLRRAYERGRLKRAVLHASPALLFVVASSFRLVHGATSMTALLQGGALYLSAVLGLWLGGGAAAAVRPALLFGLVPFVIVRVAESTGHICTGTECVSWCLPACAIGGTLGGALVGLRAARERDRLAFVLTSATLVFLAGTLACQCAGGSGILGIAAGVLLGSFAPLVLTPSRAA